MVGSDATGSVLSKALIPSPDIIDTNHAITGGKIVLGREEPGTVRGEYTVTIQVPVFWGAELACHCKRDGVHNSDGIPWAPCDDDDFWARRALDDIMPTAGKRGREGNPASWQKARNKEITLQVCTATQEPSGVSDASSVRYGAIAGK